MTRCVELSRPITRFLPSRCTLLIEWPSTSARKSLAVLCRRTARPFVTDAVLIFLPIRSRARDTRTVSTSASSGIDVRLPGRVRGVRFGALLRASLTGGEDVGGDDHRRNESDVMRGTLGNDAVRGSAPAAGLRPLTKSRLRINLTGLERRRFDVIGERRLHERLCRVVTVL